MTCKDNNDEKKIKAKQDVEQLLGKVDKKKKRSETPNAVSVNQSPMSTNKSDVSSLKSLEKKPLPNIHLKVCMPFIFILYVFIFWFSFIFSLTVHARLISMIYLLKPCHLRQKTRNLAFFRDSTKQLI